MSKRVQFRTSVDSVPYPVAYTLLFDSNAKRYGGFAAKAPARVVRAEEVHWHDREFSVRLTLPALSAVILKPAPPADQCSTAIALMPDDPR
jgi:1,4-alpha-glucan branching enzyme